jgi:nitric oxide reductase NorQ protein
VSGLKVKPIPLDFGDSSVKQEERRAKARSVELEDVEKTGGGFRAKARSGAKTYTLEVETSGGGEVGYCTCPDFIFNTRKHGLPCKHLHRLRQEAEDPTSTPKPKPRAGAGKPKKPSKPKRKEPKAKKPKLDLDFTGAPPDLVPKGVVYYPQGDEVDAMAYSVAGVKNTLLIGPAGTGKSTLVEYMAQEVGAPLITVSCDLELDKTELLGRPEIKEGDTHWVDGPVTEAMRKGYWLVFDEVNMAKPEVMSVLHAILDHRRRLVLKENGNEVIKAHENFRVFATMNPGYEGTGELNQAFKDRFGVVIAVGYMPPGQEVRLLTSRTGIDKRTAELMVKAACDTRRMAENGEISEPISPRTLLEWAQAIKEGYKPLEAARFTVLDKIARDQAEREDVENAVKNYFGRR